MLLHNTLYYVECLSQKLPRSVTLSLITHIVDFTLYPLRCTVYSLCFCPAYLLQVLTLVLHFMSIAVRALGKVEVGIHKNIIKRV